MPVRVFNARKGPVSISLAGRASVMVRGKQTIELTDEQASSPDLLDHLRKGNLVRLPSLTAESPKVEAPKPAAEKPEAQRTEPETVPTAGVPEGQPTESAGADHTISSDTKTTGDGVQSGK